MLGWMNYSYNSTRLRFAIWSIAVSYLNKITDVLLEYAHNTRLRAQFCIIVHGQQSFIVKCFELGLRVYWFRRWREYLLLSRWWSWTIHTHLLLLLLILLLMSCVIIRVWLKRLLLELLILIRHERCRMIKLILRRLRHINRV